MDAAASAEVEAFFAECPASSSDAESQIAAFFRHHAPGGVLERPVVCVTSGGTTVPMERNCVRYIDNFSAGTRGAMSTQEFLEVRALAQLFCCKAECSMRTHVHT
jgi:phosphopantothenate---cysteine ligase (ATP)